MGVFGLCGRAIEGHQLAALVVRRLETVLPRLRAKHQTTAAHERRIRWNQAADIVQGERDILANEFAATYPAVIDQLINIFERIKAKDQEIDRINSAAPSSEGRRLDPIGHQQLLTATKLLSLTVSPLWPPPPPSIDVNAIVPRLSAGGDWYQAIGQRDIERRQQSAKAAQYYHQQARDREQSEADAAKAARARNGASP